MHYNVKSCPQGLSFKGRNSFKINIIAIKTQHAHLQYATFKNVSLKTVGGVDYTNSINNIGKKAARDD